MSVGPPRLNHSMWWGSQRFGGCTAVDAAAVSGGEHDALSLGGVALGPSQPQRVAVCVEDGGEDLSVGGESGDEVRGYGQAVVIAQVAQFAGHGVVVGDHQQGGLGAPVGAFAGDEVGQGVGAALLGSSPDRGACLCCGGCAPSG